MNINIWIHLYVLYVEPLAGQQMDSIKHKVFRSKEANQQSKDTLKPEQTLL